jgi:arginyl-tRNA--protein-N-Asp/Glu arginylyltransferase
METSFRYTAPPRVCAYLPDRLAQMEYEYVSALSPGEYLTRMLAGWRRFGKVLFRPRCQGCTECRAVRVRVADFRPDRSQRRARKANDGVVTLRIGKPAVSPMKLALYDRFHAFQADDKGWPEHPAQDAACYAESYIYHPFPVEEWTYYVGRRLVGVGYVDSLPFRPEPVPEDRADGRQPLPMVDADANAAGLSAIYFFYEPDERRRSLGTWNVLCLIDEAARRGLPYVYLGYHVAGCRSLEYKANYRPNQRREDDGVWRDFLA